MLINTHQAKRVKLMTVYKALHLLNEWMANCKGLSITMLMHSDAGVRDSNINTPTVSTLLITQA